ncbi:hypothetical protein BTR23_16050 [Alkalihalophilus pseudofirmus]|nr:hypothetical protein BTR23_16050 [Alkalihalophilus pseudofirmus]
MGYRITTGSMVRDIATLFSIVEIINYGNTARNLQILYLNWDAPDFTVIGNENVTIPPNSSSHSNRNVSGASRYEVRIVDRDRLSIEEPATLVTNVYGSSQLILAPTAIVEGNTQVFKELVQLSG